MPDMTLCGGGDCPLKARCYRFRAVAYGRQSYFGRVPFVAETGKCDSFSDIAALEPTLGGINLEDIKAPECFYIERELSKRMNIPVFHDDQHGTAIISSAALLNGLELVGKQIGDFKIGQAFAGLSNMKPSGTGSGRPLRRTNDPR